jgi:hypothetical protein
MNGTTRRILVVFTIALLPVPLAAPIARAAEALDGNVLGAAKAAAVSAAEPQIVVPQVEKMPRAPHPLHLIDWKKTARDYYIVLFDPALKGVGLPAVNLALDRKHFGFDGYLIPQRARDPRGEAHALPSLSLRGQAVPIRGPATLAAHRPLSAHRRGWRPG